MNESARFLVLLPAATLLAGCGTVKKINEGVVWTYEKTAEAVTSGASAVYGASKKAVNTSTAAVSKLWLWGDSAEEKTKEQAKADARNPDPKKKSEPSTAATGEESDLPEKTVEKQSPQAFALPTQKMLVSDTDLGTEPRLEENATVRIADTWDISAAQIATVGDFGESPKLMRAEGGPVEAVAEVNGRSIQAQAREMHYREDTGVLVLKGFPEVKVGRQKIIPNSGSTLIKIHLESGALEATGGGVRTSYD